MVRSVKRRQPLRPSRQPPRASSATTRVSSARRRSEDADEDEDEDEEDEDAAEDEDEGADEDNNDGVSDDDESGSENDTDDDADDVTPIKDVPKATASLRATLIENAGNTRHGWGVMVRSYLHENSRRQPRPALFALWA